MIAAEKTDTYKLHPKNPLVFALEDFDLTFYPDEVEKVKRLWKYGWSVWHIAHQLKRHKFEIAVLLFHLIHTRQIKPRQRGVVVN